MVDEVEFSPDGNCEASGCNLRHMHIGSWDRWLIGSSGVHGARTPELRTALWALVVALACTAAFAGVPGTFRGTVHEGGDTKPGWVYVEALNGNLRLVDVRRANIHYEDVEGEAVERAVPEKKQPVPKLVTGTEVRVTAEQDKRGFWHASEIEVLRETSRK